MDGCRMGIGSVKLFLNVNGKIVNLVWATCPQTKDTMGESLLKYWISNTIRITKRSHPPLCHVIDFRPCILYPNYKYIKSSTENEFGTWRTEIRLQ